MRLIDANVLGEKLKQLHGYGDYEANIYCAESCYGLGNWVWENPEDYGVEAAEKALEEAPTIDAVPVVHGRWEEWWPGISLIMTGEEMLYRCSACDAKYPDVEGYRHCPNCGAKMDGEPDD